MQENKLFDDIISDAFDLAMEDSLVESSSLLDKHAYVDDTFPVDILEFAEGAKFLNLGGSLYPEVRNLLVAVENEDIKEADLILGKGSGKSQLAKVFSLRGIYILLSLKKPQKMFELTEDTQIYCGVVSVSRKQAQDNIFAGVRSLVENSEFFKGKAQIKSDEIVFPKNIRYFCGHSNHTAFLGYATFRAVMDEVNYMCDNNNRSVAKQLYAALRGSLKTRFPHHYKLLSISSDSLPNSFLRERLTSIKERIRLAKEKELACQATQ